MINTYEMMFILRPDLTVEQVNKQLHKYNGFLKDNGAEKVSIEVWGKRRLAYPIQKFQNGIYVLTYYTGDGTQVAKIERDMRFSDEVLRYLTIKIDSDFEFEEKAIPELNSSSSVEPKEEISVPQLKTIPTPEVAGGVQEKSSTEESNSTEEKTVAVEA